VTAVARPLDLVEAEVVVGGRRLCLVRPRDNEALIDEQAFEHEEYLPYWAELWPSALALGEALAAAPPARVLELGCGLAVPSLVAALGGAEVVAVDWSPEAVQVAAANARRNGAMLDVRRWDWNEAPDGLGRWPLVVAADVLYERRNAAPLLRALDALVAEGGEAWIADPGRATAGAFLDAARTAWDLGAVAHTGPDGVTVHRLRRR
jgi:predicted nicotinamide N-methyase